MALRCPNDHPVRESFAYCPYCMVRLHPPAEPEAAAPAAEKATAPAAAAPADVEGPAATFVAEPAETRDRWPRWMPAAAVLLVVAVAIGVAAVVAGEDGDDAAPSPSRTPTTSGSTVTSTPARPTSTAAASTTLAAVALGDPCDPATAPPGPVVSTAGEAVRCVPEVWGDPAARHTWWPVDTPVDGEWEVRDRSCRFGPGGVVVDAILVSHSDRPRDITIVVEFLTSSGMSVGTDAYVATSVEPGAAVNWEASYAGPATAAVQECRIAEVRYGG